MIQLDSEIRDLGAYYSKLHGSTYHVRFHPFGDGWKADLITFKTSGLWVKSSKEFAYGNNMLDAVKNLKELLQRAID